MTYEIPVGQYFQGNFDYLVFINDHDVADSAAESRFRNVRIYEGQITSAPMLSVTLNGTAQSLPVTSYGGATQDKVGTASVSGDGSELTMAGNLWKKVALPVDLSASATMTFEFFSSAQGDIHGIGFDNDLGVTGRTHFRLYGTQGWGIADFADYGASVGTWKSYTVNVGQFFTGDFQYLTFSADHDVASPTAESKFRNIVINE